MRLQADYKNWLLCCSACLLLACGGQTTEAPANSGQSQISAQSAEPFMSEAVSRIFNRSCQSCHGPDGHGITAVAPDLRRARPRSVERWRQYLGGSPAEPGKHPGAQMPPPTWLNADEIAVIANFLSDLSATRAAPAAR